MITENEGVPMVFIPMKEYLGLKKNQEKHYIMNQKKKSIKAYIQ